MALKLYQNVIDTFKNVGIADEAAFYLMMLTSPNISEYEEFINKYPQSKYLAEIFINIAKHYEKRSQEVDKNFSKKVIAAYKDIVKRFPTSKYFSQALIGLARNHLVLSDFNLAEEYVNKFIDQFSASTQAAEAFYIRGVLAKKKENNRDAVDIFKQVLYRYPFSAFAERSRYELALAEYKTRKVFDALSNYRLYLQNYSDGLYTLESQFGVAKCLFQLDKRDEAIEIFNTLKDTKLSNHFLADVNYILAQVAEGNGKIYDALNHYNKVLTIDSFTEKLKVLKQMGNIYFNNRIYNDAAKSFEKALEYVETESDSVETKTQILSALIMDGKGKKIEKEIAEFKDQFANKYKNNLAEIIYYEGMYLSTEKEYDKAIKRFKYILDKFDKSNHTDDAFYEMALANYYQNKMEDAITQFKKLPIEYPLSKYVPLAYFKLAMIYHGKNDFIQSGDYFSKVVVEKKVDSKTRFRAANNAAISYQKISSWLDAANMYSIILSDYSDQIHKSSFHLKLGFCLLKASKVEDAFEQFKKANNTPKKEDKPEILYWLGTCYSKSGDYSKAIAEYLKVPYLYSKAGKWGVTAEFEAARLYERLGEYSKAITLYKKIIRSDGEQGRFGKKAFERIQRLNTLTKEVN